MSCENFEEQASAYIDSELPDSEAETLFTHLGACSSCRKAMASALDLRSGLQEQPPLLAPKELDSKVMAVTRFRRLWDPDRKAMSTMFWQRKISMRMPAFAVAASILLFVGVIASSIWLESKQSENAKVQTVFLTAVPTVEVRAYTMEPVVTTQ